MLGVNSYLVRIGIGEDDVDEIGNRHLRRQH